MELKCVNNFSVSTGILSDGKKNNLLWYQYHMIACSDTKNSGINAAPETENKEVVSNGQTNDTVVLDGKTENDEVVSDEGSADIDESVHLSMNR